MSKLREERQKDLFRPAPDQFINMGHSLVRLAQEIDWGFREQRFALVREPGPGSAAATGAARCRPVHPQAHASALG